MTKLEELYNRKQSLERQLENSRNDNEDVQEELDYIDYMITKIKEGRPVVVRLKQDTDI
jgi:DNA repair ATPase RecN